MNCTKLEKLREKSEQMPPGFFEEVLAAGTVVGSDFCISQSTYNAIKAKYLAAQPTGLRGAGDLVAKFAHPIARALDSALGTKFKECAERPNSPCAKRRAKLNAALPFNRSPKSPG